jgi:rhodanese-related sulfurtransferase
MHRPFLLPLFIATLAQLLPAAEPSRPASARICATCHTASADNLRGYFDTLVLKNNSFQLRMDERTEVLRFDPSTLKVLSPEPATDLEATLKGIAKGHEVRVQFSEKDGVKMATLLVVKPPVKVAAEESISLEAVQQLVALGPDKGRYFLVDCRPAPRFMEGSIPTAVNLPFPAFDKNVDKLPKDKDALIIYFCSGKTCNMSPGSLQKVKKLGYTNAKVFVDGMPGWGKKNPGVLSASSLKTAYLDPQMPLVILDLRPPALASKGFIMGSVAADPVRFAGLLSTFPSPKLKPPVVVVDEAGSDAAKAVALQLVKAGYTGVNVLTGGFQAWQAAALPVESGTLAAKVSFTPKPRPGTITPMEFTRIAELPPAVRSAVILDVRPLTETKNGVIKGALVIPEPQLLARLSELPRDRKILCHCATGIQAELAYHLLKEKGYDIQFLASEITIIDTGEFTID